MRSKFKIFFSHGLWWAVFLSLFFGGSGPLRALLQVNQIFVIEDYEKEDSPLRLEGIGQGSQKSLGTVASRFAKGEAAMGGTGISLALDYEIPHPGSFSYFWSQPFALSGKNYFSFWRKLEGEATTSPPEFLVEFREDRNGDGKFDAKHDAAERIPASRFTAGVNKQGWQKVTLPLSRFRRIQSWSQILEVGFIFENKQRFGKGSFLVDNLLFGSNYPEEFKGSEIQMQNHVSSFKIDNKVPSSEMKLKRQPIPLTLTLTFVDPYLEEIRFEESRDGAKTWQRIRSFYDHATSGVYTTEAPWKKSRVSAKEEILVRAVGLSLLGGQTELAGPHRLRFD